MEPISSQALEVLSMALRHTPDFLIIGEMHGSKQNALLIQQLLMAILTEPKPVTVAFEWSLTDSELDALRVYVHGGRAPSRPPAFFLDSDGRFTEEHISLLKWIRSYNHTHNNLIDLHVFDADSEQAMADSLRIYKMSHPDSLLLVETGNMHARTSSYLFMHKERVPMAAILKREYSVFSIFLHYGRGEILMEGQHRDVSEATSQREGAGPYFDGTIEIPVSEAARDSLTGIDELLQS